MAVRMYASNDCMPTNGSSRSSGGAPGPVILAMLLLIFTTTSSLTYLFLSGTLDLTITNGHTCIFRIMPMTFVLLLSNSTRYLMPYLEDL